MSGRDFLTAGCGRKVTAASAQDGDTGPQPGAVEPDMDANNFKVDHPEQFPLATAGEYVGRAGIERDRRGEPGRLAAGAGAVAGLGPRGGDRRAAGRRGEEGAVAVQGAEARTSPARSRTISKAVKNEQLAKIQLDRAKLLFDNGAIPKSALEIAQNAEDNAKVDLETTTEHLRLLGSDPDHPTGIVEVYAPVSGVITDQQITNASGVQALTAPNPFTISDVSHVWIVCDVYENDLAQVHLGEYADIHLNAYPEPRLCRGGSATSARSWIPTSAPPKCGWKWRIPA